MENRSGAFFETFCSIPDPRKDINKKHLLIDMLFITLCAIITGAKSWEAVEDYALDREDWLRQYLELPNGIPSHDAIRYVFLFLNPKDFNKALVKWVERIMPVLQEKHIAIDGKTSRRSGNQTGKLKPLHTVSAWSTNVSLVLGQVHVKEKSNEITAIPDLIDLLDINGCLITIDAMGCQKNIANKIITNKGDYLIAVKKNQKHLYEEVKDFFDDAIATKFKNMKYEYCQDVEKDHGRIETRSYYLSNDIQALFEVKQWKGLKSILMVVAKRKIGNKESKEKRYYICSCKDDINKIKTATRNHWGIENSLHWVLDMSFDEDQCRKRVRNSAKNISTIRKIALNILKADNSFKASMVRKMAKASRNSKYLAKLLQF